MTKQPVDMTSIVTKPRQAGRLRCEGKCVPTWYVNAAPGLRFGLIRCCMNCLAPMPLPLDIPQDMEDK